ncbi:hypothetical protein ACFX2G_038776 [Malus domestica]
MDVNTDLFPTVTINMVNACLPRDKGKGKAEIVPIQFVPKQNFRPQVKTDLFSSEPPQDLFGPTIVESMSSSNTEEIEEPMILCNRCKANVKPKEMLRQIGILQQVPTTAMTPQHMLGTGQRHKVFDKLGPQVQNIKPFSARRRLDFDTPFYNEDYYARNSGSSSSPVSQRTFRPP